MQINVIKAVIALVGMLCVTLLMAIKAIDTTTGMPVITLVLGYAVGNGVSAKGNSNADPIIMRKESVDG